MGIHLRWALVVTTVIWAGAGAALADNSGDPTSEGVPQALPVTVVVAAYAELAIHESELRLQVARPGATASDEVTGSVNSNATCNIELTGTGPGNVAQMTLNRVDGVPVTRAAGEALGGQAFAWTAELEVGGVPAAFAGPGTTCKITGISPGIKPLTVRGSLTTNADFGQTVLAGSRTNAETLTITLSG